MSYVNSASCKFVATHCVCCGRALSDAPSIEAGMGPHCREKYGYDEAQGPADEAEAMAIVAPHREALELSADIEGNPRRFANVLVHRLAVLIDGEVAVACVNALRALGFSKLSRHCAARMVKISVSEEKDEAGNVVAYTIKAPYSEAVRRLSLARWDRELRVTRVRIYRSAEGAQRAIEDALTRDFPGALVDFPRGVSMLDKPETIAA